MNLISNADIIKWQVNFSQIIKGMTKESIDALNSKDSLTKWYARVKQMNHHLLPIDENGEEINFTQLRTNLTAFNKQYYSGFFEKFDKFLIKEDDKDMLMNFVGTQIIEVVKNYYKNVEPILDDLFIKKIDKRLDM